MGTVQVAGRPEEHPDLPAQIQHQRVVLRADALLRVEHLLELAQRFGDLPEFRETGRHLRSAEQHVLVVLTERVGQFDHQTPELGQRPQAVAAEEQGRSASGRRGDGRDARR